MRSRSAVRHKPLSLLIESVEQAEELANELPDEFYLLAEKFWPGPLTIIVRAAPRLPLKVTANSGNIAVRMPDSAVALAVVRALKCPITATSANLAGCGGVHDGRRRGGADGRTRATAGGWRHDAAHGADDNRKSYGKRTMVPAARGSDYAGGDRGPAGRSMTAGSRRGWLRPGRIAAVAAGRLRLLFCMECARIVAQSGRDEAQTADAIVVFGAAEYFGKPSPVYRARLDHAFDLYERKLAPVVITTGGSGGEQQLYRRLGGARLPD